MYVLTRNTHAGNNSTIQIDWEMTKRKTAATTYVSSAIQRGITPVRIQRVADEIWKTAAILSAYTVKISATVALA